jgi:hypothetical protein
MMGDYVICWAGTGKGWQRDGGCWWLVDDLFCTSRDYQ